MKYIVCYSGGHSSAICAIEAVRRYGKENVILLNHGICPRVENPDIKRFRDEVAEYLGLPITPCNMDGFETKDQFDVCVEARAFHAGLPGRELCTNRLKTKPFMAWLAKNYPVNKGAIRDDIVILYGFDPAETNRMNRRKAILQKQGYIADFPLSWDNRTIKSTEEIGISRPSHYQVFCHANCYGCLKGGKQHWYVTYCLMPEIFQKAKWAEEKIGHSILSQRQGFLKDLEGEFETLKRLGLPATEKIKPQTFWAMARKLNKKKENEK
jgi:hypothetical protein